MGKWLKAQWRKSYAKIVWDDLTVLGRLTIWVPIWLVGWVFLPVLIVLAGSLFLLSKISDKPLVWLRKQFIKD